MKLFSLLLISVFLIFSSISCTKKTKTILERHFLSEKEKSYIPFQGGEIITFKSSEGLDLVTYSVDTPEVEIFGMYSPSLSQHNWEGEQIRIKLLGENQEIQLFMRSMLPPYFTSFKFEWRNNVVSTSRTVFLPIDTSNLNTEIFLGDFSTANKLYFDVFMEEMIRDSTENDSILQNLVYPLSFYFSPGYGIIRMDLSDSTFLELENIDR